MTRHQQMADTDADLIDSGNWRGQGDYPDYLAASIVLCRRTGLELTLAPREWIAAQDK